MSSLPPVGASAELVVEITEDLIRRFTALVGDDNPVHHDDSYARRLGFPRRIAHGMSYACFLSTMIGTKLPGPGSLWAAQTYRFVAPAFIGDRIVLRATVKQAAKASRSVVLSVEAVNQSGVSIMEGESTVLLPGAESAANASAATARPEHGTRVALVAGASGSLGESIAKALGRGGYAVALCGRDKQRLFRIAEECRAAGVVSQAFPMELGDQEKVDQAVDVIQHALGPVSVAVHCASAALPSAPAAETGWERYREHFEVQVGGLHRLVRRCAPEMCAAGTGHFIYIGSTATHGVPPKGQAAYTAAKAAGVALMKTLAVELGPRGIRANIVSPYFMTTNLTHAVSTKAQKLAAAGTPLRRLADLKEVSSTVAFLASDGGSFINGHDLLVDGGAVMS